MSPEETLKAWRAEPDFEKKRILTQELHSWVTTSGPEPEWTAAEREAIMGAHWPQGVVNHDFVELDRPAIKKGT